MNTQRLGAGLLAAGPILMQFGNSKPAWWIGFVFTISGPILMAIESKRKLHDKPKH